MQANQLEEEFDLIGASADEMEFEGASSGMRSFMRRAIKKANERSFFVLCSCIFAVHI